MKRWIWLLLVLSGCAIFKERNRLKTDSLGHIKLKEQLDLHQQWHNSEYQFKDSKGLQLVLIKADAPFRWQVDSGLTAKAGNYQLYLMQQGNSLTTKKQSARQELLATNLREEKEVQKTVNTAEKLSSFGTGAGIIVGLALLLVIGLTIGRRYLLKWFKLFLWL